MFPLTRSIVALGIVAILGASIVWIAVRLVRSAPQSLPERIAMVVMALALSAIALWIIFVLPVYWD